MLKNNPPNDAEKTLLYVAVAAAKYNDGNAFYYQGTVNKKKSNITRKPLLVHWHPKFR